MITPQSSAEDKFLAELNMFRNEVLSGLKFLYTELAIHKIAGKDKEVLSAMNSSPTFWNTILNALQHSTFITLGRIFDIDSDKHTIHTLFKIIEDNKSLFTKESFSERRLKNSDRSKLDQWLQEYTKNLYVPTSDDFRKLKKYIQSQKKTYQEVYAPIRHHFGHRIYIKNEEIQVLFNKVKIKDIEKFYVRLYGVHEALWQLYHNGRGPLLPIREKSIRPKIS